MIELFYDDTQISVLDAAYVAAARAAAVRTETWVYLSCGAMFCATRCVFDGEEHDLKTDDDRRWFVKRLVA